MKPCHLLESVLKIVWGDRNKIGDYKERMNDYKKLAPALEMNGYLKCVNSSTQIGNIAYTASKWLKYKQCYQITEKLAEDLYVT